MLGYIILIWIISLIWIFFDVLYLKKSLWEAFVYFLGALLIWIIVFPYWTFYERRNILEKNKNKIKCPVCNSLMNNNNCSNCGTSFKKINKKKYNKINKKK